MKAFEIERMTLRSAAVISYDDYFDTLCITFDTTATLQFCKDVLPSIQDLRAFHTSAWSLVLFSP